MKKLVVHLCLGLTLAWATCCPSEAGESRPPNIVFMLADDLGYGDLACYGHPYARTPNLDRLAKEGTRCTQFYVTGVTCCPSRTGFMTGKFPATFQKYPAGAGFGDRVTVTELLKKAGYATGHFGKWHIGSNQRPGTYGIDTAIAQDADAPASKKDERGRDAGVYDAAIKFIAANRDRPFYANVWGHITHFPVDPPQSYVDKFNRVTVKETDFPAPMREKFASVKRQGGNLDPSLRRYLGDLLSLDENVGRLLKKLDELGLRENTIVVFSSDQGPAPTELPAKTQALPPAERQQRVARQLNMMGSSGELRGGKHGMLEGGVRVPFIIRWPGQVPAGRVDATSVTSGIDWLPTLCGLAGAKIEPADFDGENVLRAWLGATHIRSKPLFWKTSNAGAGIGIRDGPWKLYYPNGNRRVEASLYDVVRDPGEQTDLSATHPDIVKSLTAKVEKWNITLPQSYEKTGTERE